MAVIAALLIGFLLARRHPQRPWTSALPVPLTLVAVELIWNSVRFGLGAMTLWAPILTGLTIATTRIASAAGGIRPVSSR
jgi:hypothetical protein